MSGLFPALLATHVTFAVALLLPSLLLPFALRGRATSPAAHRTPTRALIWLQTHGTLVIGLGVAATGVALLLVLGAGFAGQPWLLVALGLYATTLLAALFVQRPNLRRLFGLAGSASEADRERWRAAARRQRYVSYLMAAGIGVIAYLMSTKPAIW
ncbi:MAG: DUF2269 family protein [Candidatus Limnocylindrales bacterium]